MSENLERWKSTGMLEFCAGDKKKEMLTADYYQEMANYLMDLDNEKLSDVMTIAFPVIAKVVMNGGFKDKFNPSDIVNKIAHECEKIDTDLEEDLDAQAKLAAEIAQFFSVGVTNKVKIK